MRICVSEDMVAAVILHDDLVGVTESQPGMAQCSARA
jgi:hypothetical protein